MQVDLTIKNYRCFSDQSPARLSLQSGFTAFVGMNNSGKSTLLRFLYEMRGIFTLMGSDYGTLSRSFLGPVSFSYPLDHILVLQRQLSLMPGWWA